jgi:acetyl esterase/lipase
MNNQKCCVIFCLLLLCFCKLSGQNRTEAVSEIIYKQVDSVKLRMKVWYPKHKQTSRKYPAIIFFFGGGWKHGDTKQFEPQAKYFASKGLIAVTVDYRVAQRNNTTPFEAVKDARSAIRYLRANSRLLNIDEHKIIAAGGSAGGHLAAASDLITIDEATDDLKVSSRPNAVILYNPVINNGPDGYGYKIFGNDYAKISPFHNIIKGAAPTLIMSGTHDKIAPVHIIKSYQDKMIAKGNRCEVRLYDGQVHGFYNPKKGMTYYNSTLHDVEVFLNSLRYIDKPGT